jgi:hypothetical protein
MGRGQGRGPERGPQIPYTIEIESRARRDFLSFPPEVQARISDAIDDLATNPRPPAAKRLVGQDGYRLETGGLSDSLCCGWPSTRHSCVSHWSSTGHLSASVNRTSVARPSATSLTLSLPPVRLAGAPIGNAQHGFKQRQPEDRKLRIIA